MHLDVYDIGTGQWKNLDPIFSELGIGEPSGLHRILPDGDSVWINAPAHRGSKGGLIQLDLKKQSKFVFRKELVDSESEPDRLDYMSLLSSPNYVWAYFQTGSAYNFFIAVYDKKDHIWTSYNRAKIVPAIELLINELPNVKWSGKNFLINLSRLASEKLDGDHPYRLTSEQLKVLRSALNKLEAAFEKYNLTPSYDDYGMHDYSLQNSAIYGAMDPGKKIAPIYRFNLAQIRFVRLIGTTGHHIVLETNEGLAILDPGEKTLQHLSPLRLSDYKSDIWWSKDKKRAIIRNYHEDPETSEEYHDCIALDFENLNISRISKVDEPETKVFQPLSQDTLLMDNKEIYLEWDGLLIKHNL